MITTSQTANAIAQGRATRYHHTGAPMKVGHEYPVKVGASEPVVCRVRILEAQTRPVGTIVLREARQAGHRSVTAFKAAWVLRHDERWLDRQPTVPDAPTLAARFNARHAGTLVQVVVLGVLHDEPRYLASQYDILHGHTDRGEFTTRRGKAIDELEVVDEATADRFAKAAETHGLKQRERYRNQRIDHIGRKEAARRPMRRNAA